MNSSEEPEINKLRQRLKDAIGVLEVGHSIDVNGLKLFVKKSEYINVIGKSEFNDLKQLTNQFALKELEDIKEVFNNMRIAVPEFSDYINNLEVRYQLCDWPMMGLYKIVCQEIDGKVTWGGMG